MKDKLFGVVWVVSVPLAWVLMGVLFSCTKDPTVPPPPPPALCTAWEYKTLFSLPLKPASRNLDGGGELATAITPSDEELTAEGMEGWELISTYLETETGYLETDKQILPNVRPQRLVMVLKRPYCPK